MTDIISISDLANAVKQRRKSLGLKQSDAAALCGVGNRFFSELENGKDTLQIGKVLTVTRRLGLDLIALKREERD